MGRGLLSWLVRLFYVIPGKKAVGEFDPPDTSNNDHGQHVFKKGMIPEPAPVISPSFNARQSGFAFGMALVKAVNVRLITAKAGHDGLARLIKRFRATGIDVQVKGFITTGRGIFARDNRLIDQITDDFSDLTG